MDTKTLVVGQKVFMGSGGVYGQEGTVERVSPDGVEVRVSLPQSLPGPLLHFDKDGKGRDDEGTYECGPWRLADPLQP
jgi:hypothetical protein